MIRFRILVVMSVWLFAHALCAQKFFTREQLEAVLNPPLLQDAGNILRFDSLSVHAGTLSEDDAPVTYVFTCRNISGKQVEVTRIKTTCGCTDAAIGKTLLEPGDGTDIRVTFNPFGHPGKLFTRAFVYVSLSEKEPVASLAVVGEVQPSSALWKNYRFAMGNLRVVRKDVDFGRIKEGVVRTEKIACANSGSRPLTVKAVGGFLPGYLSVRTEPETLEASEEGFLLIEVDGEKLSGEKGGERHLNVLLDGIFASPSERTLRVSLEIGQNDETDFNL